MVQSSPKKLSNHQPRQHAIDIAQSGDTHNNPTSSPQSTKDPEHNEASTIQDKVVENPIHEIRPNTPEVVSSGTDEATEKKMRCKSGKRGKN